MIDADRPLRVGWLQLYERIPADLDIDQGDSAPCHLYSGTPREIPSSSCSTPRPRQCSAHSARRDSRPTIPRFGVWFWATEVAARPTTVPATNKARPRMSPSHVLKSGLSGFEALTSITGAERILARSRRRAQEVACSFLVGAKGRPHACHTRAAGRYDERPTHHSRDGPQRDWRSPATGRPPRAGNPGLDDAACFATVDPNGFYIGELGRRRRLRPFRW